MRLRPPRPGPGSAVLAGWTSSAAATCSSTWSPGCRRGCSRPSTTPRPRRASWCSGRRRARAPPPPFLPPLDEKHRIYSRKATAIRRVLHFAPRAADEPPAGGAGAAHAARPRSRSEVPREADRMLLARYGPPGVVVDEGLNILEFRGDTDPFLEHGHGQASLNLIADGPQGPADGAAPGDPGGAEETDAPVRKEGLQIRYRGQLRTVSIEVDPASRGARPRSAACSSSSRATASPPAPSRRAHRRPRRPAPRRRRGPGDRAARAEAGADRPSTCTRVVQRARGRPRGAAVHQRGGPLQQRRAAERQRGAADGQGGDPVRQRGAGHAQPGAAGPQRRARAGQRRPAEPARQRQHPGGHGGQRPARCGASRPPRRSSSA